MVLKSTLTLIKLAKQRVDQQRIRVAKAQDPVTQLKSEIYELETTLESEARLAVGNPVLSNAYGPYATGVKDRILGLEENLKKALLRLSQEQERLSQLFQDQEGAGDLSRKARATARKSSEHPRTKQLDEIALRMYETHD